jgi:hypothetical protein
VYMDQLLDTDTDRAKVVAENKVHMVVARVHPAV